MSERPQVTKIKILPPVITRSPFAMVGKPSSAVRVKTPNVTPCHGFGCANLSAYSGPDTGLRSLLGKETIA